MKKKKKNHKQTCRLIDLYRIGQMTIASEDSSEELLVDVTWLDYNKAPLLIALSFNIWYNLAQIMSYFPQHASSWNGKFVTIPWHPTDLMYFLHWGTEDLICVKDDCGRLIISNSDPQEEWLWLI